MARIPKTLKAEKETGEIVTLARDIHEEGHFGNVNKELSVWKEVDGQIIISTYFDITKTEISRWAAPGNSSQINTTEKLGIDTDENFVCSLSPAVFHLLMDSGSHELTRAKLEKTIALVEKYQSELGISPEKDNPSGVSSHAARFLKREKGSLREA